MTDSEPRRFRKRPIEVDAYQLTEKKEIKTREGVLYGYPGDWIITGIEGEIYPCGKEIFEKTYESASHTATAPGTEPEPNSEDNGEGCTGKTIARYKMFTREQLQKHDSDIRKDVIEKMLDGLDEIKKKCDADTSISPLEFHKGQAAAYHLVKWWIDELIEPFKKLEKL